MIGSLINGFSGYVDFSAKGADIGYFLTFCAKNALEIINPIKKGYVLYGSIQAKDYKKFRKPARKYGIRLKIIKKHGFPFLIKKHRHKIGFASGMIFIIISVLFLNLYVWEINVIGNKTVPSEKIICDAKEMGLFEGTLSKKHFVQDIEWYILRKNEGLASVEINIQGSVANIIINETTEKPEMKPDDDIPVNIVASRYGVIKKINVFDGQKTVKPGDAVMKGDLLVSAVYEDRHNKLTLKHARAKVIAETDYNISVEFPFEQKIYKKGNLKKKSVKIMFPGMTFKFGNDKNDKEYQIEKENLKLRFFWIELPINIEITRFFAVKVLNVTYNKEQAKSAVFQLLKEKEADEMKEMEIKSRSVEEKIKDGKYILNANYICLMDIAEEQPVESDVPWENTDEMS